MGNILFCSCMRITMAVICLISGPALSAAEKIYRAPIDGFVTSIPLNNSLHDAEKTRSQYLYDTARVGSNLPAKYFPPASLDKNSVTFDLDKNLGLNVAEKNLQVTPIFSISSDLLEIQFQQELIKFRSAKARHQFASDRYTLESQLAKSVAARLKNSETYRAQAALEAYYRNRRTVDSEGNHVVCKKPGDRKDCTGLKSAKVFRDSNKDRSQAEMQITTERNKIDLNQLANSLALAKDELESSQRSLVAIAATIALGDISCPVRCRITDVYVVPGQYVSKGDPLFSFLWLTEQDR